MISTVCTPVTFIIGQWIYLDTAIASHKQTFFVLERLASQL